MTSQIEDMMAAIKLLDADQKALIASACSSQGDQTPSNEEAGAASTAPNLVEGESEGSQPIQKIENAGVVEITWAYDDWAYDDDLGQKMCDKEWTERLNDKSGSVDGGELEYAFETVYPKGGKVKYRANITDVSRMTITKLKTKTQHVLHKLEMRVLSAKDMLAAGSTAAIDEYQKDDAWTMRWQFEDNSGWQNMTEDVNKTLLTEIAAQKAKVEVTHEWKHPTSGYWNKTKYDVDLSLEQQTSHEWHKRSRAVRLVAMRECHMV
jgi:hypothetical protein